MNEQNNLIQELQALKLSLVNTQNIYLAEFEEISLSVSNGLKGAIEHVNDIINHCIELQLAIMKDDRTKNAYVKKDV